MKRRILSLLLVFVMLLGLMPTTALAVTNGSGTQQSPLSVTTYEELKAALADNTTQYIVVNEFETNYDDGNGGFYQINQVIAEDYALYSNPAVDKHLTINTAVRISTSAQCTNVKTGLEVGGNLTIDGTGIFNMSFYGTESRCVVVNVPKSGKLIVNGQVTIDATSVWHSDEINQEAESIHSKGHIVFNGGTFIGYFSRVSSTMGSVCAVYVEAGRSEYYGGNFKTVNHSAVDNGVQIDKGCEDGVILINRPSANGTKKVPELTKLKGGTFQSIVIVNYEDTSDVIGNLLVGCILYDADDKHELDDYYALNYVHNATVLKYNLDITFDANGGKGVMNKVTFNTLSNDYFTLPESEFYAPQGKRFKCWSIDGIEKAVGETFEPTKDTVISAVWVDIPANELGGKGTKESPLYVNTYAELKAALADDVTEYIIVKDFLYTNDGGYHLINNPIDGEDYALWSNPDIHKHLTIDTKVRLGVYLACPNITKGIEVAGKLTIDGSGSFNTSFLSNKRGTVINVTSTGTLIVEDPVTIDATSIWHTEQHNIEAEAIHSKGHLTINGGTFKGHFDRVSSTSVTLNAVYVEAGKAEFYGGDFRTVNTRTSVDKGCEGGLLVVSNPSANNGKDINELIKLDGGTYQRFAVFSLGNKQWEASDLMFGSDFLDAETGNEIAAEFYDTTYIPNLRVVKHTYHVWFDSNGGKGSMSMVTLNNKNYKLPPCDITAPTGMKFKGWAVNSADSDDIYHTGENFVLKGDTVLYAAWEKNVIDEVKINTTEPAAGNYIGDQEISILTDDSSLSIYAHEWYESEEKLTTFETFESGKTYRLKVRIATTKSFTNDAKVYVNGEEATVSGCDGSSILFYYDFTLPSYGYTITFGADGGTGEMAAIPDASGEYTLPVCRFAAPRGKQFKVWKVNGVEKAVGDKIVITADTTIIAVWEELPTAMVSYHENGGSGTMVGDVVTIGDKFTLENCTYIAPEGYQFKAWAIGSVNGEQKQPGEQITITGETYIYAIWEAVEYDVTIIGGTASVGAGTPITKATMGTTVTLTAGAAPSGQMFDKWVVNGVTVADENSATTTFVMPNGAVTATATYKDIPAPTEYMVSYYPGEAEGTPDSDMIVEGTQFTLAACMFQAPEGKMFKAWAIGSLNGEQKQPGEQITITGETYIYAIWEAVEYDVTVTGGTASVGAGTPITKATMGTTVTLTAGAAPSGQMFDKWVVNGVVVDDANSATTTFTMPANNVTAQATYKDIPVVTYTVSFDANGGSGTMTPATGVSGDYVLPVCGFTAPNGKQFKAWSVGGVEKDAGATINVTANTTVTAIWENIPVVTYTVSFAANGGTGTMADATGISGEYTLPANGFTAPDGMQFKAWMVGGSEKAVGDKITVTANTTVTAIWENIPVTYYTVTFDSAGGSAVTAQTIEAGQKATKPADPTKAGYDFKGWTLNGSTYDFNSAVNGDITLVATWEQQQVVPTVYTVTFDSNGGSAVTAQNIEAGQKATKPADPTKAGYDFKGWTLNGSAYDFNTAVNGDITLVATWEQQQVVPTTYTVSFVANGGTGTMADVTGISGEYTLPANGFTAPDGKQFKAWSVGGVEKAVGDKITVTADTTVTAVWETIPAGHTCDIKPVAKVEPSCTEGGKEAYYKCEGCGKFYEDALGAKEITDLAAWGNIAKNGHTESDWKSDKDNHWKECTVAACGVIIENSRAAHADANNDGKCDTCEYNVGTTTTNPDNKPSDDVQSPQTGDNSMMWLWVALLFVSGFGVVATTVYGKRRTARK